MNNAADDVSVELYAVQKEARYVRIGFEDNPGSHDFRFFNLLRCRHLLINSVLLLSGVLGSAVRIANFSPDRGCSDHFCNCTMMRVRCYSQS